MHKDSSGRYLMVGGGKIYISGLEYLVILAICGIGVLCFVGLIALIITSLGA